jgi:hypothetical protein
MAGTEMTMRSHVETARLAAERTAEIERLRPTLGEEVAMRWAAASLEDADCKSDGMRCLNKKAAIAIKEYLARVGKKSN